MSSIERRAWSSMVQHLVVGESVSFFVDNGEFVNLCYMCPCPFSRKRIGSDPVGQASIAINAEHLYVIHRGAALKPIILFYDGMCSLERLWLESAA